MRNQRRRFIKILVAILMMTGLIACRQEYPDQNAKTGFYLINNTHHTYTLYCHSESNDRDTTYRIDPNKEFCILEINGIQNDSVLNAFIRQKMIRLMDEHRVDWLPRISDPEKWGDILLPGEAGTRKQYFILLNPYDDGMARLQNLGIIKLFRILQALSYLILLSSIIGLLYVRLRFKLLYIILAIILNYPVIYYTADFGYFVRNTFDPLFLFPTWAVESTAYFVRFSFPVGAMFVWILLIGKKFFQGK